MSIFDEIMKDLDKDEEEGKKESTYEAKCAKVRAAVALCEIVKGLSTEDQGDVLMAVHETTGVITKGFALDEQIGRLLLRRFEDVNREVGEDLGAWK